MNEQKFTWFPKITRTYEKIEDEGHKLLFIEAALNYGTYGIETELPYPVSAMFESIKEDIEYSLNRRKDGAKGGSAKSNSENKNQNKTSTVAKGGSTVAEPPLEESVTPLEEVAKGGSEGTEPNTIQYSTVQNSTKNIDSPVIAEIVDYLNEKANTSYRSSSKNTKAHIRARLKEGFTVQDFKTVIDGRIKAWAKDPRMCEYIRPDTLFGSKFESYLNAEKVGNCTSQGGDGLDEVFEEYGKIYDERAISIEELDRMAIAN